MLSMASLFQLPLFTFQGVNLELITISPIVFSFFSYQTVITAPNLLQDKYLVPEIISEILAFLDIPPLKKCDLPALSPRVDPSTRADIHMYVNILPHTLSIAKYT